MNCSFANGMQEINQKHSNKQIYAMHVPNVKGFSFLINKDNAQNTITTPTTTKNHCPNNKESN